MRVLVTASSPAVAVRIGLSPFHFIHRQHIFLLLSLIVMIVVSMQTQTVETPISVMTYNILEATNDGKAEGGQHVASWSSRQPAAVADLVAQFVGLEAELHLLHQTVRAVLLIRHPRPRRGSDRAPAGPR